MKEIWKDVPGYEGMYRVSNLGRVKSLPRIKKAFKGVYYNTKQRILKNDILPSGYYRVVLHKNSKAIKSFVHRLVARTFIPNPERKPEVNHKNGVKADNKADNLEWTTAKENTSHAAIAGLRKPAKGENHARHKLTWQDIEEIRKSNKNQYKLAAEYGVKQGTISAIINHRTWK